MRIKLEHQNIFFTSDFHVFHTNKVGGIIAMDKRPFNTLDEMHESLIKNWNNVVDEKSIIFYLGDLSFGRLESTIWFINQLNGKIYWVLGNHDNTREVNKLKSRFGDKIVLIDDYIHLSVKDEEIERKWQEIMLMHYPILSWNNAKYGSWHLHGHEHGNLMNKEEYQWYYKRKVLDVGCNMHNYTPLSYKEIKNIMNNKEEKICHHE